MYVPKNIEGKFPHKMLYTILQSTIVYFSQKWKEFNWWIDKNYGISLECNLTHQ